MLSDKWEYKPVECVYPTTLSFDQIYDIKQLLRGDRISISGHRCLSSLVGVKGVPQEPANAKMVIAGSLFRVIAKGADASFSFSIIYNDRLLSRRSGYASLREAQEAAEEYLTQMGSALSNWMNRKAEQPRPATWTG